MNYTDFLSDVFLFKDMSKDMISKAICDISLSTVDYSKRDEIYSPIFSERRLGFVVSGECKVERIRHDGTSVPLNVMKQGNSFGIVSVLKSEDEFPTRITATKDTKVLYISLEDTWKLIKNYTEISQNVISFLAGKIIFLNKKIATFSEDSVEDKLSSFLSNEYIKYGAEFPFNCKRTAESISVGRASLYRALASLTEENVIKLENKKIYITDPEGLERKSK